jgi:hypothetical protein
MRLMINERNALPSVWLLLDCHFSASDWLLVTTPMRLCLTGDSVIPTAPGSPLLSVVEGHVEMCVLEIPHAALRAKQESTCFCTHDHSRLFPALSLWNTHPTLAYLQTVFAYSNTIANPHTTSFVTIQHACTPIHFHNVQLAQKKKGRFQRTISTRRRRWSASDSQAAACLPRRPHVHSSSRTRVLRDHSGAQTRQQHFQQRCKHHKQQREDQSALEIWKW